MADNSSTDTDDKSTPNTPVVLPPQSSPEDTSNWDDRIATAPDGNEYIRNPDETDIVQKSVSTNKTSSQKTSQPKSFNYGEHLIIPNPFHIE
jgi:hypothetical protein